MAEWALEMRGITKELGGVPVLRGADLRVRPGEVHALMGENGAGKSTLMKLLFGMPEAAAGGFGGEIFLGGERLEEPSPQRAAALGMGMVHQEFMLLPGFTAAENIKVGREPGRPGILSRLLGPGLEILDREAMAADARRAMALAGLRLPPEAPAGELPVGQRQLLEMARELDKGELRLLVLDEPTAVLTGEEAGKLLRAARAAAERGTAVILITHRLEEVMGTADSLTVLRDGVSAARLRTRDTTPEEIARLMMGRPMEEALPREAAPRPLPGKPVLTLRDYRVEMPGEEVRGVDLQVLRGEILGIGGLSGQGKLGIPNGLMGLYPAWGEILLDGEPLDPSRPGEALRRGLAFLSEDRRGVGILPEAGVAENIAFAAREIRGRFLRRAGPFSFRDDRAAEAWARGMMEALDIRCSGPRQPVGSLSGGNQQKVCLARALTLEPRILFVSEPTRGVDIGAKERMLETLRALNREKGVTVVAVSSELAELRSLCHRIAVVSEGRISRILPPDAPAAAFGLAMSS